MQDQKSQGLLVGWFLCMLTVASLLELLVRADSLDLMEGPPSGVLGCMLMGILCASVICGCEETILLCRLLKFIGVIRFQIQSAAKENALGENTQICLSW